MNYLVDVNVWLALAYVAHVHHPAASLWFDGPAEGSIAFCRVTQNGFLRLLTNHRIMGPDVLSASRSWDAYDKLREDSRVGFAPEPPGLEIAWRKATRSPHTGPNFWTDAYLAAFASAAGLTIVTFDRAFRHHRDVQVRLLTATT